MGEASGEASPTFVHHTASVGTFAGRAEEADFRGFPLSLAGPSHAQAPAPIPAVPRTVPPAMASSFLRESPDGEGAGPAGYVVSPMGGGSRYG